jgi:hypothetical protein
LHLDIFEQPDAITFYKGLPMAEYFHEPLDEEVRFISGSYAMTDEGCLPFRGRNVLYRVGIATVDNACCGTGGCRFIRVAGYVLSWKERINESSVPISTVEPIVTEGDRRDIAELLSREYPHSQIYFDNG